jgi:hypothetical protein
VCVQYGGQNTRIAHRAVQIITDIFISTTKAYTILLQNNDVGFNFLCCCTLCDFRLKQNEK